MTRYIRCTISYTGWLTKVLARAGPSFMFVDSAVLLARQKVDRQAEAADPKRRVGVRKLPAFAMMLALAAPAMAQDTARALCADRPGLGTPACTLDKGRVALEVGIVDWTHGQAGPIRSDTIQTGEALLRAGLTDSLEAQLGWAAFGHMRVRDAMAGTVVKDSGIGDVTLALRQNLHNPDGSGISLALMPYVLLPVGGAAIGAGDWGAGLIVPMSAELSDSASFALTARVDAAPDADRDGRHLGFGVVAGLGLVLSKGLSASAELSLYRDRDPTGSATRALTGISVAWQDSGNTQWDLGANIGLNDASPDVQIALGYVRRF